MKWTALIKEVSEKTGQSERTVREVLRTMVDVSLSALTEGEEVHLHGLCTVSSRWQEPRTLRSVHDQQTLLLNGRFVPRLRPAARLRRHLADRTPQHWRDPAHQNAWRVAQTLIDDLALYSAGAEPALTTDSPHADVHRACAVTFGPLWNQVLHTYNREIPEPIRQEYDHLAHAARQQWGTR